jgi:hypothetical protein
MSRFPRATFALCVLALAALGPMAAPAWAKDPLVYLSWGAPWGQPGARGDLRATRDTTRVDTLYLSFDPGDVAPSFVAITVWLKFRPPAGDTLGAFWHFERTEANPMSLRIEVDVTPYGSMSPWSGAGMGMPTYQHTAEEGTLMFVFAVPANRGMPLKAGTLYSPARVLIGHNRSHLGGHDAPLCIEWSRVEFAMTPTLSVEQVGGGSRVASWNSPGGKVCEPFRIAAPAPADTSRGAKTRK